MRARNNMEGCCKSAAYRRWEHHYCGRHCLAQATRGIFARGTNCSYFDSNSGALDDFRSARRGCRRRSAYFWLLFRGSNSSAHLIQHVARARPPLPPATPSEPNLLTVFSHVTPDVLWRSIAAPFLTKFGQDLNTQSPNDFALLRTH